MSVYSAPAIAACLLLLALTACGSFSPEQRRTQVAQLATQAGWRRESIDAAPFTLVAYRAPRSSASNNPLTVYIEGDGLAWLNRWQVSLDPTPINALGLKLALRDPSAAVAYLARPCQLVEKHEGQHCQSTWWTTQRFAPSVLQAMNHAIDVLQQAAGARQVILVGYSGGGAIASLLAARRRDVALLITVAGNLDVQAWTQWHQVSALSDSLNPADAWRALSAVPQIHWVGGQDLIMPPAIANSYAARFPAGQRPRIEIIPEFDHACCWEQGWPTLLQDGRRLLDLP